MNEEEVRVEDTGAETTVLSQAQDTPETQNPVPPVNPNPAQYQQNPIPPVNAGQYQYQQNAVPPVNPTQPVNPGQYQYQQNAVPPVNPNQAQYQQNGAYQQSYYSYGEPAAEEKGDGTAFGIASMVLGIVALLLFCTGCHIILAILAIVFGIIQLVRNKQKGFAIAGIVTAGLAIVTYIIFIIVCMTTGTTWNYLYNYADQYYDDGDSYNYDYYDDYNDLYDNSLDGFGDEL